MKIGIKYGLDCGHFTLTYETESDSYNERQWAYGDISFIGQREYCENCNDMKRIKRVQIFLIGEFPIREFP